MSFFFFFFTPKYGGGGGGDWAPRAPPLDPPLVRVCLRSFDERSYFSPVCRRFCVNRDVSYIELMRYGRSISPSSR